LPVDNETVNKIFQYFHIYNIRVKELIDTEYKQKLGSVKTRWLSLEPAVHRVIEMYQGLNHIVCHRTVLVLFGKTFLIILSLCCGFFSYKVNSKHFVKPLKKLKVKIYQQVKWQRSYIYS
jgi:hypothetical protein